MELNQEIRGYQLIERIGEGGFGVVFRALQPLVERDVVVKAILPIYANNANFIRNFEAEAQLIAQLEHLHIVPLYDYWRDPNGAYIVMRFLKGGNLVKSLQDHGAWSLDHAARLLEQIGSALALAHQNDIIHQDVKPANILLDEQQNAYLSDFGIARDLRRQLNLSYNPDEGTVHGSPAYMAPEQITDSEVTTKADIYSLGIVMFELITGNYPFEKNNLNDLLQHQVNTKLPPLHNYNPNYPPELSAVLWKATAKVPDSRYESAIEMAQEFSQVVRGMSPVQKQSTTVVSPARTADQGVFTTTAVVTLPPQTLTNPYKGLRAFTEADAANFFGREQLIQRIIERISSDNHFLAVVGPSGSGKSSAVKAGVIAKLRHSMEPLWKKSFMVEMVPGGRPLTNLRLALYSIASSLLDSDLEELPEDTTALHTVLTQILPPEHQLLLVIDQFEETFTQTENEQERRQFLNLISHAVSVDDSRLRVIVTLRADFYDRPLMYPQIGDLIRSNTEVVLPLSGQELKSAILGPAKRMGLVFEEGLVELILQDMQEQPNALPLLQYTLTELYERRDKIRLTLQAYQAIGGIIGSVARRAQELFLQMNPVERQAVREIFLRLVGLADEGEDTRKRTLQSELYTMNTDKAIMQQVLDTFGKYRLLTFDNDPETRAPTVEIAHEALIRHWDQLKSWLSENRDNLRLQRKLSSATNEWVRNKHSVDYLAQGLRLAQFEPLRASPAIALSQEEQQYIHRSMKRQEKLKRRVYLVMFALLIFSVVAGISALIAITQRNETQEARDQALVERDRADLEAINSRSRELAASALANQDQLDLALLLSLEASSTANTFEARHTLLSMLQAQPHLEIFLHGHADAVRAVDVNNQIIITGGRDGMIRVWDAVTFEPTLPPLTAHEAAINVVSISTDGTLLASGDQQGQLTVWDIATGESILILDNQEEPIESLAFSPDSNVLAAGSGNGILRLWNVSDGTLVSTLEGHTDVIYDVVFSQNGTQLISASGDGSIRVWILEEDSTILTQQNNWVLSIALHPNGRLLASGSADGTFTIWDMETNTALTPPIEAHNGYINDLAFTPDGLSLITAGADGLIQRWDLRTVRMMESFAVNFNIRDIALNGSQLISTGALAEARVWSVTANPTLGEQLHLMAEQVISVAFSPDDQLVAFGGGLQDDFAIRLWDQTIVRELLGHTEVITGLIFTEDMLISASADQTIIIWDIESGEIIHQLADTNSIFSLAYDGNYIISGNNDGQITIWQQQNDNWTPARVINAHSDRITDLAVSPSGQIVASASRDGTIQLWDIETGEPVLEPITGHTEGILSIAFSPDGQRLASSSRDLTIRLWNPATGEAIGEPLAGYTNWVMDIAFSPDGRLLAAGDGDNHITLWDISTGRALGGHFSGHDDWVNTLTFSHSGDVIASGGRDGQLILWQVTLPAWREAACRVANRGFTPQEINQYFPESDTIMTCSRSTG